MRSQSTLQVRVPSAVSFMRDSPDNVYCVEFGALEFDNVEKVYVVPVSDPSLNVDEAGSSCTQQPRISHSQASAQLFVKMLRARNKDEVRAAWRLCDIWAAAPGEPERLRLHRLRHLHRSLCAVAVLTPAFPAGRTRCSCEIYVKHGQCPHELYVRWLLGDDAMTMVPLAELTKKIAPKAAAAKQKAAVPQARRGPGRQPGLPAAAALLTMQALAARLQERAAAKSQKEERVKNLFASPERPRVQQDSAAERESKMAGLAEALRSPDFKVHFHAMSQVSAMAVTLAEAQGSGIGKAVHALKKRADLPAPAAALAQKLMKRWLEESQAGTRLNLRASKS